MIRIRLACTIPCTTTTSIKGFKKNAAHDPAQQPSRAKIKRKKGWTGNKEKIGDEKRGNQLEVREGGTRDFSVGVCQPGEG